MKQKKHLVALFLGLIFSGLSLAASKHEIGAESSSSLDYIKSGTQESSGFMLGASYATLLTDTIQLGTSLSYTLVKLPQQSAVNSFSVFVGPIFNLNNDLAQSYFAQIAGGFYYSKVQSTDDADLAIRVIMGKRIPITETVVFKPYASYTYVSDDSVNTHIWHIVPLSFSAFFD